MIKREADQEPEDGDDLWMRTVRAGSEAESVEMLPTNGPTYKVDVVVDSLKARALLDHGIQVSIVRRVAPEDMGSPRLDTGAVPD